MLNSNETSDTILARADNALYAAKAQGRNRITSA
jgi:diguanylate cyclase